MDFFAEYIFAAVIGLYMDEKAQSLLNSDEILICSSDTTSEEVLPSSFSQKIRLGYSGTSIERSRWGPAKFVR